MKSKFFVLIFAVVSVVGLPVDHSGAVLKEPALDFDGAKLELDEEELPLRTCSTRDGSLAQIASLGEAVSVGKPGCRTFKGRASLYGNGHDIFAGRKTASGEKMNPAAMSGAMRVFNARLGRKGIFKAEVDCSGKKITVNVNDWGPGGSLPDRVIDLSPTAARGCGFTDGVHPVSVVVCELDKLKGASRKKRA